MDDELFNLQKQKAKEIYGALRFIFNPFFGQDISLTAKGFYHLQASGGRIRDRKEQAFKFKFLELGFEVIRKSSTIQEYRQGSFYDEKGVLKQAEYWGMIAIVGEQKFKIRAVLRRVGDGDIHFWSVMPYSKIKNGRQKIYDEGIENG